MTKDFSLFLLMVFVWSTKGLLLGAGGPQQLYDMQRFLAVRSPRSAAKAGMLWGAAMTPMFMLSAAVAIIGIVKFGGKLPHPEHLYPVVIGTMLPIGIKGLVLAGLLSAFMSTYSSTENETVIIDKNSVSNSSVNIGKLQAIDCLPEERIR